MGVRVNPARNRAVTNPINGRASRCEIRVLTSQEDEQIARHTGAFLPQIQSCAASHRRV
jgi:hypothetical protein